MKPFANICFICQREALAMHCKPMRSQTLELAVVVVGCRGPTDFSATTSWGLQ